MKASQQFVDSLINAAINFGLGIPTSVNEQLTDNGYDRLSPEEIILRSSEILSLKQTYNDLLSGIKP